MSIAGWACGDWFCFWFIGEFCYLLLFVFVFLLILGVGVASVCFYRPLWDGVGWWACILLHTIYYRAIVASTIVESRNTVMALSRSMHSQLRRKGQVESNLVADAGRRMGSASQERIKVLEREKYGHENN